MATISNNEIKIKYSLDTTDLANATALFDRLSAEDRQLLNDLKRLQAQMQQTGQAGQTAMNNVSSSTRNANNEVSSLNRTISSIKTYVAGAFAVDRIIAFGKAVLDTAVQMESLQKAIEFTSKSMVGGQANFQYLKDLAEEFGVPLQAAAEGFKSMSAAAARNNISMGQQREMFRDLTKAMSALNVTSQDASLILFGFGQMLSKPKVSAQELYHQIGERLPLGIQAAQMAAAKLTGQLEVTSGQLIKLVEDGKLVSGEFAPEFTKALGKLAESGAYVDTLGKNVTRLSNAWEEFKTTVGNGAVLTFLVKSTTEWVKTLNLAAEGIGYLLSNLDVLIPGSTKQTWAEFRQTQELIKKGYDDIVTWADKRDNELQKMNSEYQSTFNDLTESGNEKRLEIEKRFSTERQSIVEEILNGIKKRETEILQFRTQIAEKQKQIDDKYLRTGVVKQLEKDIQFLEKRIKGNMAQIEALTASYGTLPSLAKMQEDPESENKRQKALENRYKKELEAIEARMKAEEDLIKSRTKAGTNQDIILLKNNDKFNKEMLAVDQKYEAQKLELAKNNRVKREAEIVKDFEMQDELRRQAFMKASAMEEEYTRKAMEVIQDAQRKRRQALQTEEENELQQNKDFWDDKVNEAKKAYQKQIAVEGLSIDSIRDMYENYQNTLTGLTKQGEEDREEIRKKYREKERIERAQTEFEVRKIVVDAAVTRNVALAKYEREKADIADEGAMAQIKIAKDQLIFDQNNLKGSIEERINANKIIEAKMIELSAKEIEITKNMEERKLQYREEKELATIDLANRVTDGLFNIYQQRLNNELTLLNRKYDQEIKLADGNQQKIDEINQRKAEKEKELKERAWKAEQAAAIARVIFETASIIARQTANPLEWPLVGISLAAQAAQIGFILAQPVPEFAEGTKGKEFEGGPAIVGERGYEKVVTKSGKVYFTPGKASLVELPKGSQVIPNHALSQQELFWANALNNGRPINPGNGVEAKLDNIGNILKTLPVHQINMDERGFEKFIRTERRTTKILNNRFRTKFST